MSDADALTIDAVVDSCTLVDISVFELSARRLTPAVAPDEDAVVEPEYGLQIDYRDADNGFRVRLETRFDTHMGLIVSDVGAEYELDGIGARSIPRDMLLDFVNNVALMALLPYVRESVADITLKVFRSALLMPMMRRGELSFSEDDRL